MEKEKKEPSKWVDRVSRGVMFAVWVGLLLLIWHMLKTQVEAVILDLPREQLEVFTFKAWMDENRRPFTIGALGMFWSLVAGHGIFRGAMWLYDFIINKRKGTLADGR